MNKNYHNSYDNEKNVSEKIESNVTTPKKKIAEKIVGASDLSGQLEFLLKWQGIEKFDKITAAEANLMCPQIVIIFYEERVEFSLISDNNN